MVIYMDINSPSLAILLRTKLTNFLSIIGRERVGATLEATLLKSDFSFHTLSLSNLEAESAESLVVSNLIL